MIRISRLVFAALLVTLAFDSVLAGARTSAATSRTVTATATCDDGNGNQPTVSVKVTNHSGSPLVISYAHGFTTPQVFQVRMKMTDPGTVTPSTVADGKTATITAPWDDLREDAGDVGGALLVTNLGNLVPACTTNPADQGKLSLGPAPTSAAAKKKEAVEIAAKTLGELESWRAYPALYALLHPDSRAAVPFNALACWYADRYGTVDTPADQGILNTTVTSVSFGAWTWSLNDKRYPDAAAVAISQQIGTIAKSQPSTSTEHLVAADGQWRWFFGSTDADVAALDTSCDLGPGAITGEAQGTGEQPTPAGAASITMTNYSCPAEMTVETLDPTACALDPGAATWTLTGAPLSQPLTWADVTQHQGPGYSWEGLAFGEYIITPDSLPDGTSGYAVTGSSDANRQDAGIALTLGADDPNMMLAIYLFDGSVGTSATGSIEVDFYDCQPGMTPATFDPSACSPLPQGFDNVILTPGSDVPAGSLPGGPSFRVVDGTNLGNGAFKLDGLPFATYQIGPGQNYRGPLFYAPDFAAMGSSGIAAPTYEVTISADNPNQVIALYRLATGIG
jgi:hypothetical protein